VPYRKQLQPPQPSGATSDWYSTSLGPVAFIQINSEQYINGTSPSAQYKWLEAELAAVDRSKTPWIVVGLHRPVYVDVVDSGEQAIALGFRAAMEPLFAKYQVCMRLVGGGGWGAARKRC
jgi:hypothetical protein